MTIEIESSNRTVTISQDLGMEAIVKIVSSLSEALPDYTFQIGTGAFVRESGTKIIKVDPDCLPDNFNIT